MTSAIVVNFVTNNYFFNMRENYDWVDNKLERHYGTTQYNLAVQEYMDTEQSSFDIFDNINHDNDYVTYTTPFFGEAYYNYNYNDVDIEDIENNNIMNIVVDEENEEEEVYQAQEMDVGQDEEENIELEPRNLTMEFDEAEIEGMYINYDDNAYFGYYKCL